MPIEEEEYEIVPVGPIRRIERRMEKIEKGTTSTDMVKELIEVVRTNQKIIDEVVKINSEMINRVSDLATHVSQLNERMNDFLDRVEVSSEAEQPPPVQQQKNVEEMDARMQKLEKRINSVLLSSMRNRPVRPTQMVRRPMSA